MNFSLSDKIERRNRPLGKQQNKNCAAPLPGDHPGTPVAFHNAMTGDSTLSRS
jgi:hypothetical protein